MGRLRWPDRVTDRAGNGIVQASCTFAQRDTGAPVVVYPDRLGTLASGQPLICDRNGEVTAFVDEADLPVRVTATLDGWSDSFDWEFPSSATPLGGAGGVLSGQYPNPGFANDMAFQSELDAVQAQIATTPSPPSGLAAGDLSGTYPNPNVVKSVGDFVCGGRILIPTVGVAAGLLLGGDVNLYRSAADELTIPDRLLVVSPGIGVVAATIKGLVGQTAPLLEVVDSAAVAMLRVAAVGSLYTKGSVNAGSMGSHASSPTGYIKNIIAASPALIVQGAGSQAGDLQQWLDSANAQLARITAAGVLVLAASGQAASLAGYLDITRASAINGMLRTFVTGDTVERFNLHAGGLLEWGPGLAVALDTNLYRSGVGQLKTDGSLVVVGRVTPDSLGSGVRDGTKFLRDDGSWQAGGGAPTGAAGGDLAGSYPNPTIGTGKVTAAQVLDGSLGLAELSATGVKDATTYLRGDNTFAVPAGGGGSGLAKVTSFPGSPADGDVVVRTDLNGSPLFAYSTENGWEQQPRMGAVTVPSVRATRLVGGAQAIANAGTATVLLPTEDYDTDSLHDLVTNTSRLTVRTPGLYAVTGYVQLAANAAGVVIVDIVINGVAVDPNPSAKIVSGVDVASIARRVRLAAGDYVELRVQNTSGASVTIGRAVLETTWYGGPGQTVDERGVPAVAVRKSANQTLTTATDTLLTWDTEDYDTEGLHDTAALTSRLVARTAGLYRVTLFLWWATNGTGGRRAYLDRNSGGVHANATTLAIDGRAPGLAGQTATQVVTTEVQLAAGDYVEAFAFQDSGGNLDVLGAAASSRMQMSLVGSGKTVTPYCDAYRSTNDTTTVTAGAAAAIPFNAEIADNDGIHDTVTNPSRFVCRTAGVYNVSAVLSVTTASAGARWITLRRNGIEFGGVRSADTSARVTVAKNIELAVGDYVELWVETVAGVGTVTIFGNAGYGTSTSDIEVAALSMVKVGAPSAPVQTVVVSATRVTTLPVAPVDGQEVYFVADAANGVIWHLRYNAGSSSAYKWEYVGGSRLNAEVLAGESPPTLTSSSFQAMATPGPSITLPLAGDYIVEIEARLNLNAASYCLMSYDIGATPAVDADGCEWTTSGGTIDYEHGHAQRLKTGLGAVALVCKYAPRGVAGQTPLFKNRRIQATPVRVG